MLGHDPRVVSNIAWREGKYTQPPNPKTYLFRVWSRFFYYNFLGFATRRSMRMEKVTPNIFGPKWWFNGFDDNLPWYNQ